MKTINTTTSDKLNLTNLLFNVKGKEKPIKLNFLNLLTKTVKQIAGMTVQNRVSESVGQSIGNSNPSVIQTQQIGNFSTTPFVFRSINALTAPTQPNWQSANPMHVFQQSSESQKIPWIQSTAGPSSLISSGKPSDSVNAKARKIVNRESGIGQITVVNTVPVMEHSEVIGAGRLKKTATSFENGESIAEKGKTIVQSEPAGNIAQRVTARNNGLSVRQTVNQNNNIMVPGSDLNSEKIAVDKSTVHRFGISTEVAVKANTAEGADSPGLNESAAGQKQFHPVAENAQKGNLAGQMKINPSDQIFQPDGKQGSKSILAQSGLPADHRQKINPAVNRVIQKESVKTFVTEKKSPVSVHNDVQTTTNSTGKSGRETDNTINRQIINAAVSESKMVSPETREAGRKLTSLNAKILNTTVRSEPSSGEVKPLTAGPKQEMSSARINPASPGNQDTAIMNQAEKITDEPKDGMNGVLQRPKSGTPKNIVTQNSETDSPSKAQGATIREQNSAKNSVDSESVSSREKVGKVASSMAGSRQSQTSENPENQHWPQKMMEKTIIQPKTVNGFSRMATATVVSRIVDMVERSIVNQKYHVNFRVDTGEMGEIEMHFSRQDGINQGTILVNSENVFNEFQKLIPSITEQLAHKNIDLDMLNVQMNDSNRNRSPQHKKRSFNSSESNNYTIGEKVRDNSQHPVIHDYGYNTVEYIA